MVGGEIVLAKEAFVLHGSPGARRVSGVMGAVVQLVQWSLVINMEKGKKMACG